jgi:aspartate kinase
MSPDAQSEVILNSPQSHYSPQQFSSSPTTSGCISTIAPQRKVRAFKFGGTSLLGAERMLRAANLVREAAASTGVVVIVSAMKGVTDRLLSISRTLHAGCRTDARRDARAILDLHLAALRDLQLASQYHAHVARDLHQLGQSLLHDAEPEAQPTYALLPPLQDRLASYGERFSAVLFAAALEKSGVASSAITSSEFVLTCETFRDARPHLDETRRRGRQLLLPLLSGGIVPVVTGFIGATPDGRVTTLGRNSSDFSGALVASVVDASELVIWTDVDGIFTANPH